MEESKVKEAADKYISQLQEYADNDCKKYNPNNWNNGLNTVYSIERTKKWLKVIEAVKDQRSVFAFIDPENGNIYKAAGWNAAAKGVRGNVFNEKLPLTSGALYRN